MGQVIIEGVVSSDVCDQGARHTVEFTPQIGAYVRNGLIRVVGHITPEPVVVKRANRQARANARKATEELQQTQQQAAGQLEELAVSLSDSD